MSRPRPGLCYIERTALGVNIDHGQYIRKMTNLSETHIVRVTKAHFRKIFCSSNLSQLANSRIFLLSNFEEAYMNVSHWLYVVYDHPM